MLPGTRDVSNLYFNQYEQAAADEIATVMAISRVHMQG